jgi:hypothetical protein
MVTKKSHVPLDCETSKAGVLKIIFFWQVDCDAIFSSDEIDRPAAVPPIKWEALPEYLQVFLQ